jgi:putative transposase
LIITVNLELQNAQVGRKNPAAGVHVKLERPNFILLTVTTQNRVPWLTNPTAHGFLRESWFAATAWLVGDYLLMPDHLHLFCAPKDLSFTFEKWIAFWKRDFRRRHQNESWKFQSRGWHHCLRDGENYSDKWRYVQVNPMRKNLVKRIDDWSYKGRVHQIAW